mgnify:CR=1 FL=1
MEARAIAKTLRVSPIKTRLVVDLIRGKDVNVALSEEHCDYKWVKKDSDLLDDYIKDKLVNIR